MSELIYENTHMNRKVKIDRRRMERKVENYSRTGNLRDGDTRTTTHKTEDTDPHKVPGDRCSDPETSRKRYRVATLFLGLLCFLLLTGIIVLSVYYNKTIKTSEKDLNNLSLSFSLHKTNTTVERDQLQTSYNNMTKQRDQLQTSYNNLTQVINRLQTKLSEIEKLYAWRRFGSRLYFLSTEQKPWEESRQDCLMREAHLVIITSEEEQRFLNGLQTRSWIGLTDKDKEGTWKWVDGTSLTTGYWGPYQPDNYKDQEDCAEIYYEGKKTGQTWNDLNCEIKHNWICEKSVNSDISHSF